jgi:hypothetical protein
MHATPFIVLLAVALLAACALADQPTAPDAGSVVGEEGAAPQALVVPSPGGPGAGVPASLTRLALERAASGLLYTSESDYPFTYFFHSGPAPTPITVAAFRTALALAPDTPVEVVSLDEFFARHIERVDPADAVAVALVPRYRLLRETIRHAVRQPRVFRVGRIAIECYIVGTDRAGNIVGLTTVAIET